jgi:acyl-CoA thioesterase-1
VESFFGGLTQDGATPDQMGAVMQSDGIHPNAEGVSRIVEALGPAVEELIARAKEEAPAE